MKAYDRGFRDGLKEGEELAYHVALHGHEVIAGMFRVSTERLAAATQFVRSYEEIRRRWGRCPGRHFVVRALRLGYLECVSRDCWRRAA